MKNKKILIFYPHLLLYQNDGISNRYVNLLLYFNSRGFVVDFFTDEKKWKDTKIKNSLNDLVSKINVFEKKSFYIFDILKKITRKIRKKISGIEFNSLPDHTTLKMKSAFKKMVLDGNYDYILISYVQWAKLIDDDEFRNITKVLDLSDFTTLQLYEKASGKVKIGKLFDDEIQRVNSFDIVLSVSQYENNLFSSFCKRPEFINIPIFMEEGVLFDSKKDIDILFIGSDNIHNIKGINWFFEKVHPLLSKDVKIGIVGNICNYIEPVNNVILFGKIEDTLDIYNRSKIAISPLLSGSGMKVKIVEAISYGLPVITLKNSGVEVADDGSNGVFEANDTEEFALYIKEILEDENYYSNLSEKSINYFYSTFSNKVNYNKLDKIF